MQKFRDIIERVEFVRRQLRMNKSQYAAEIDMKPQTYNNFIGSQASKPNIELIYGVVNRYGVNPLWMFTGKGSVFLADTQDSNWKIKTGGKKEISPWTEGVKEDAPQFSIQGKESSSLKKSLDRMEPLLEELDTHLRYLERNKLPTMERMIFLLQRYYRLQPLLICDEMKKMLGNLQRKIDEKETKPKKQGK